MNSTNLSNSEKTTMGGEAEEEEKEEEEKEEEEGMRRRNEGRKEDSAEINHSTHFGKLQHKVRCIKWKIQTAINENACKRYARGDSPHQNSNIRTSEMGEQKHFETWKLVFWTIKTRSRLAQGGNNRENQSGEGGGG